MEGSIERSGSAAEQRYLRRKSGELSLINRCLARPLALDPFVPGTLAIDQKFRLAAALRAERSLQSWAVTETARPEAHRWRSGAFQFSFGYQRADLTVRGPAIYDAVRRRRDGTRVETIYTGSGMSAIAALFTGLTRLHPRLEVIAARGCYSETRELLGSFGERVAIVHAERWKGAPEFGSGARVLLIDSCVRDRFFAVPRRVARGVDLVVFDTTCFWTSSLRIRRVVEWCARCALPLALVRSHAKLDCLGIEYGRLGSIVLTDRDAPSGEARRVSIGELDRYVRDSVRLFGAAPIPAHFPPFTGDPDYGMCSRARTASIIRNTRRLAQRLAASCGDTRRVTTYQHGLYLTLAPLGDMRIGDAKSASAALCASLAARGLPVKHAGSFGFDFVAIEWFPDAYLRRNVIRIAGADLPPSLSDSIAEGIDHWWTQQAMKTRSATPSPCEACATAGD